MSVSYASFSCSNITGVDGGEAFAENVINFKKMAGSWRACQVSGQPLPALSEAEADTRSYRDGRKIKSLSFVG